MSDWPPVRPFDLEHGAVISTGSILGGLSSVSTASTAWPSANLAIGLPFRLAVPKTVYKMATGAGATAGSNNFDIGIYDQFGNRIVNAGATAKGNSVEHIINVTDTVIGPGLYYLVMAADGTGNYVMITPTGSSPVPLQKTRLFGVVNVASAYSSGLPATLTFAAAANVAIPALSAWLRSY